MNKNCNQIFLESPKLNRSNRNIKKFSINTDLNAVNLNSSNDSLDFKIKSPIRLSNEILPHVNNSAAFEHTGPSALQLPNSQYSQASTCNFSSQSSNSQKNSKNLNTFLTNFNQKIKNNHVGSPKITNLNKIKSTSAENLNELNLSSTDTNDLLDEDLDYLNNSNIFNTPSVSRREARRHEAGFSSQNSHSNTTPSPIKCNLMINSPLKIRKTNLIKRKSCMLTPISSMPLNKISKNQKIKIAARKGLGRRNNNLLAINDFFKKGQAVKLANQLASKEPLSNSVSLPSSNLLTSPIGEEALENVSTSTSQTNIMNDRHTLLTNRPRKRCFGTPLGPNGANQSKIKSEISGTTPLKIEFKKLKI